MQGHFTFTPVHWGPPLAWLCPPLFFDLVAGVGRYRWTGLKPALAVGALVGLRPVGSQVGSNPNLVRPDTSTFVFSFSWRRSDVIFFIKADTSLFISVGLLVLRVFRDRGFVSDVDLFPLVWFRSAQLLCCE